MKTLFIDTTSNTQIILALVIDGKRYEVKKDLERQKAQVALPMIQAVLEAHNLTINDIDELAVNPGPGSFTGIRVGVSIANALSFALGIPVNKINVLEKDTFVEPVY